MANDDFLRRAQQKHPELVAQAQLIQKGQDKEIKPNLQWAFIKSLFIVESNELHGSAYVTKTIMERSQLAAVILTVTNLINTVSTFPFLLLISKDLGLIGYMIAISTGVGLNKISNALGTAATAQHAKYRLWSKTPLIGLIAINILQSAVGGIGTLLMLDKPNLSDRQATKLIETRVVLPKQEKAYKLSQQPTEVTRALSECSHMEAQLTKTTPNTPQYMSLFLPTNGLWADHIKPLKQRSYYSSPVSQWPICPRSRQLETLWVERRNTAAEELQRTLEEVKSQGNLLYLGEKYPKIYKERFDETGNMKSAMDEATIAFELFTSKLLSGKWIELGLSLYIFLLSVITSAVAVGLIAIHSPLVAITWSEAVARERRKYLAEKRAEYLAQQQLQKAAQGNISTVTQKRQENTITMENTNNGNSKIPH